jgi:hypothetical protein
MIVLIKQIRFLDQDIISWFKASKSVKITQFKSTQFNLRSSRSQIQVELSFDVLKDKLLLSSIVKSGYDKLA